MSSCQKGLKALCHLVNGRKKRKAQLVLASAKCSRCSLPSLSGNTEIAGKSGGWGLSLPRRMHGPQHHRPSSIRSAHRWSQSPNRSSGIKRALISKDSPSMISTRRVHVVSLLTAWESSYSVTAMLLCMIWTWLEFAISWCFSDLWTALNGTERIHPREWQSYITAFVCICPGPLEFTSVSDWCLREAHIWARTQELELKSSKIS